MAMKCGVSQTFVEAFLARVATPLLLRFQDAVDVTSTQRTFASTQCNCMDAIDAGDGTRAPHNPSVVGSIPTGPTN